MRMQRYGYAIGASLVGLALLLAAPGVGATQETVRSGVSADKPLSYHLSASSSNSFFTGGGIWVRHEGMWAFRPTRFYQDPQTYFFRSWQPYGYSGWDLVPGGWLWFPGQPFASNRAWDLYWDLWFVSSRFGYGTYGHGQRYGIPWFLITGDREWLTPARADLYIQPHRWDLRQLAARRAEHWQALRNKQQEQDPRPDDGLQFDPVRNLPFVPPALQGSNSGASAPATPTTPSIDPARMGPRVKTPTRAAKLRTPRQNPQNKAGDPMERSRSKPAAPTANRNPRFPRSPAGKTPATGPPRAEKHKSPRVPATGTPSTGPAKSSKPTSRPLPTGRVKPGKKTGPAGQ